MKNYIYPALAVTIIALLSGFLLSLVNDLTKGKIAKHKLNTVQNFMKEVLPPTTAKIEIVRNDKAKDQEENAFTVETSKGKETIVKAWMGMDETGQLVGRAYQSYAQGYGDKIEIMLGVNPNGEITTYKIIAKEGETPGLGSKIADEFFVTQWTGLKYGPDLKLDINGGKVKAITGATISSAAVLDAVTNALKLDEKIRNVGSKDSKNQQTQPEN